MTTEENIYAEIQHDLPKRVGALERDVSAMAAELHTVSLAIANIASKLDANADRAYAASKPQWSVIAAWAGVFLVVIGLWTSGYLRDLERIGQGVQTTADQITKHSAKAGHGPLIWRVESNKEAMEKFDSTMHREIEHISAEVESIDDQLEDSRSMLLTKINDNAENMIALDAGFTAKIQALERVVFEKSSNK